MRAEAAKAGEKRPARQVRTPPARLESSAALSASAARGIDPGRLGNRAMAALLGAGRTPRPERESGANAASGARAAPGQTLSGGASLDRQTRAWMESRFGEPFNEVRIHNGSGAAREAAALGAKAFTVGSTIVFGEGHYAPHTPEGRGLLAHELAHVVQQRRSEGPIADSREAERDARTAAHQLAIGGRANIQERAEAGTAQLESEEFKSSPVTAWQVPFGEDFGIFVLDPDTNDTENIGYISGPQSLANESITAYEHGGKDGHDKLTVSIGLVGAVTKKTTSSTTRWPRVELHTYQLDLSVPGPSPTPSPLLLPPKQKSVPRPQTPVTSTRQPEKTDGELPEKEERRDAPDKNQDLALATKQGQKTGRSVETPAAASRLSDQELAELTFEDRLRLLQVIADKGNRDDIAILSRLIATTPERDAEQALNSFHADNGKLLQKLTEKGDGNLSLQLALMMMDLSLSRSRLGSETPFALPPLDLNLDLNGLTRGTSRDPQALHWLGNPLDQPAWTKALQLVNDENGRTAIFSPELGLLTRDAKGKWHSPSEHPDHQSIDRALRRSLYLSQTGGQRFLAGKGWLDEDSWREHTQAEADALTKEIGDKYQNLENFVGEWEKTQTGIAVVPGFFSHLLGGRSLDESKQILRRTARDIEIGRNMIIKAQTPEELAESKAYLAGVMRYGDRQFYRYREDVYMGGERTITGIKVAAVATTAVVASPVIFTTLGGAGVTTIGGKVLVIGVTSSGTGLLTGTMGGVLETAHRGASWEHYGQGFADNFGVGFAVGGAYAAGPLFNPSGGLLRSVLLDASLSGTNSMVDSGLHGGSWDEAVSAGRNSFLINGVVSPLSLGIGRTSLPLRTGLGAGLAGGLTYITSPSLEAETGAVEEAVFRQALLSGSLSLGGALSHRLSPGPSGRKPVQPGWERYLQNQAKSYRFVPMLPVGGFPMPMLMRVPRAAGQSAPSSEIVITTMPGKRGQPRLQIGESNSYWKLGSAQRLPAILGADGAVLATSGIRATEGEHIHATAAVKVLQPEWSKSASPAVGLAEPHSRIKTPVDNQLTAGLKAGRISKQEWLIRSRTNFWRSWFEARIRGLPVPTAEEAAAAIRAQADAMIQAGVPVDFGIPERR
ncbi:MAG: DUF4157 domain-containing protein [Cyanobacteriota bacterium]|nr:DUF4157 domain-containing protein [Cyanobacteriota bacterium]